MRLMLIASLPLFPALLSLGGPLGQPLLVQFFSSLGRPVFREVQAGEFADELDYLGVVGFGCGRLLLSCRSAVTPA